MRHTRIIVAHHGGPDALQVIEEECPEPKDREVRVKVLAAGVGLPKFRCPDKLSLPRNSTNAALIYANA